MGVSTMSIIAYGAINDCYKKINELREKARSETGKYELKQRTCTITPDENRQSNDKSVKKT